MPNQNNNFLNNARVADFGEVVFVSKNHTIPALPNMDLIVLKNGDIYQAICIDIEIDATGNTVKDACDNLKQALFSYIKLMVENYNGDTKAAMEDIVNTAFGQGDFKTQLLAEYLKAEHQYLINKIFTGRSVVSRRKVIADALRTIFQLEPIRFNLTSAVGSV